VQIGMPSIFVTDDNDATLSLGMSQHISLQEAADHFGVSVRTIQRWVKSNRVKTEKVDGQRFVIVDVPNDKPDDIVTTLTRQCQLLESQLLAKDEQIKNLQSAMDQAQQLHALSQKHHESELAKIEGRSLFQRLKAILVANP
jgi:excisionase family DNA binding protein|tara:strand:- start:491 stop:916 length:426 start_codon:yes stop_codon:yes gene_type:complete